MHPGPPIDERRRAVLLAAGCPPARVAAVLAHTTHMVPGDWRELALPPYPVDPRAADWRGWLAATASGGVPALLGDLFPALHFPLREAGAEMPPDYRACVFGGRPAPEPAAPPWADPEGFSLELAEREFGAVPVLGIRARADFARALRCLGSRNRAGDLPPRVGAMFLAGVPNRRRRAAWLAAHPPAPFAATPVPPGTCDDDLVLLSRGPYAGLPPPAAGLDWEAVSFRLRLEHELAHLACQRLRGALSRSLTEELVADFCAVVAVPELAPGQRESLLRDCLGLHPGTTGPRFHHYLPPDLLDLAAVFARLLKRAGRALFATPLATWPAARRLALLATFSLEDLADDEFGLQLHQRAGAMEPYLH
jgi:hypothetical protein